MIINISHDYPPNFDKIKANFPVRNETVYTYGGTIYAPKVKTKLSEDLVEHETVHMMQQKAFVSPDEWWDRYISDVAFRTSQELSAYRKQYQYFCSKHKDKNVRTRFLVAIARDFSSDLYGLGVDFFQATQLIGK